ncbi:MAG: catalase [Burkholderiaceae bacterium]
MVMWQMSDRAIPRGYRMMRGFGEHTFRVVNAEGRATLERKPLAFPSSRSYCYFLQYPKAHR